MGTGSLWSRVLVLEGTFPNPSRPELGPEAAGVLLGGPEILEAFLHWAEGGRGQDQLQSGSGWVGAPDA